VSRLCGCRESCSDFLLRTEKLEKGYIRYSGMKEKSVPEYYTRACWRMLVNHRTRPIILLQCQCQLLQINWARGCSCASSHKQISVQRKIRNQTLRQIFISTDFGLDLLQSFVRIARLFDCLPLLISELDAS
jgi:hypothetical protein